VATDSFSEDSGKAGFIAFDEAAYKAMASDRKRTPQFAKAIQRRLAGSEGQLTVLDIGTGPYALLAILAAKAGAKKVYAVECVPEAARRAEQFVAKAVKNGDVKEGQIEILTGFSTEISLPEKVDVVVAEIIGTIASEEGAIATVRDAQQRLVKNPGDAASWIPYSVQTIAAPASYSAHSLLGPPEFDWAKLDGVPVRLNCREEAVQLMAEPQVLEDVRFNDLSLPEKGDLRTPKVDFEISADRLAANQQLFYKEIPSDGTADMGAVSQSVARGLSGMALWPRIQLDEAGTLFVESRGPNGEAAKSHWTTAMVIMADRPVQVAPGDKVTVGATVSLTPGITSPPKYALEARLDRRSPLAAAAS